MAKEIPQIVNTYHLRAPNGERIGEYRATAISMHEGLVSLWNESRQSGFIYLLPGQSIILEGEK